MSKQKENPGPKPDRVKIEEDWEEAVRKALKKKRPKDGWPKDGEAGKDNSGRDRE